MEETLLNRFLWSAFSPLSILLKITGVFVNPHSDSKWKRKLNRLWAFFLLILAIQSNFYIFVKRSQSIVLFSLFTDQQIDVHKFINSFVNTLIRLCALVSDITVHLSFVFKMWPSLTLFLQTLESVDLDFKRPNLSSIKRYSSFGLVYILFTVFLNWIFGIYWDLTHPTRFSNWYDILQNLIRILSNQGFTVVPVWVFVTCGQLYLFYIWKLIAKLKLLYLMAKNTKNIHSKSVTQQTFGILRSLRQLYLAADLLHRHFSTMLMVNSVLTFMTIFTSTYYANEFIQKGYVVIVCWEVSDVLDSFFRFWLICHTSDRIRKTIAECGITVLRSLRDSNRSADAFRESNKITSYIIEISQIGKQTEICCLKGILPLSKRLIIPTLETILTFLIIIYQFQSATN